MPKRKKAGGPTPTITNHTESFLAELASTMDLPLTPRSESWLQYWCHNCLHDLTKDVNSGGFLKPVFGVGFGMQVLNANIWILFLSCQDPEEDRAVGAKDDKQVVFADLAAVVRKLSREGENITGLVHCGQLTSALRVRGGNLTTIDLYQKKTCRTSSVWDA